MGGGYILINYLRLQMSYYTSIKYITDAEGGDHSSDILWDDSTPPTPTVIYSLVTNTAVNEDTKVIRL